MQGLYDRNCNHDLLINADNKIIDHNVMSLDTPQVLNCIGEFYEWKQKQAAQDEVADEL